MEQSTAGARWLARQGKEEQDKQDLLCLKKKKQKDFRSCGLWRRNCHSPQDRKFFGYFFSKK
jgi:hypothetical protein